MFGIVLMRSKGKGAGITLLSPINVFKDLISILSYFNIGQYGMMGVVISVVFDTLFTDGL